MIRSIVIHLLYFFSTVALSWEKQSKVIIRSSVLDTFFLKQNTILCISVKIEIKKSCESNIDL